jgi:hypothetical protein
MASVSLRSSSISLMAGTLTCTRARRTNRTGRPRSTALPWYWVAKVAKNRDRGIMVGGGAKPGERRGGRQRGAPNKRTLDVIERLAALRCDPITGRARMRSTKRTQWSCAHECSPNSRNTSPRNARRWIRRAPRSTHTCRGTSANLLAFWNQTGGRGG